MSLFHIEPTKKCDQSETKVRPKVRLFSVLVRMNLETYQGGKLKTQ